jgi:hypothetical protein
MRIEGINKAYFFEAENDDKGIIVTCGDIGWNRTSLFIDKKKFKKEMTEFLNRMGE